MTGINMRPVTGSMSVTLLVFVGVLVQFRPVSPHMRAPVAQGGRFSYDSDPRNPIGMRNWARNFPACGGAHQSPVDIRPTTVRYNPTLSCPKLTYVNKIMPGTLTNNGHTVEFKPQSPQSLRVTGVPYRSGEYILDNIHLHYGPVSAGVFNNGRRTMLASSEHTLAGRNFDGELHVELYNWLYGSLEEAEKWKDGVVVLAFFVQRESPKFRSQIHPRLSSFLETLVPRVTIPQTEILAVFDLRMLHLMCDFYIYSGSTTTPECEEAVTWVVFREPIPVTEEAWDKLALLQRGEDFSTNVGNCRVKQPLNEREIQSNFPMMKGDRYSLKGQQKEPDVPLSKADRNIEESVISNVIEFHSRGTSLRKSY